MIHLLSPAKSLDFESELPIKDATSPEYLEEAEKLVKKMKSLSKKKVKDLMSISDALTELNRNRYQSWEGKEELSDNSRQAIFAFTGDVYQGLDANTLSKTNLEYAQKHLLILSGMYGAIRPLDIIEPYRLEMGTSLKIGRANNLYEYWKDKPTQLVNEALKNHREKVVINLASNEYFKVIDKKGVDGEIISPEFKDAKNGKYKIISFYAKKARGLMSRYLIENQISTPEELEGFDYAGYRFNAKMSKKGVLCLQEKKIKDNDEKKQPDLRNRVQIDEDKISHNPHNLPYAHTVGSAIIFPDDKDRIKSSAMSAMVEQTNVQMKQIYDQMELLINQANGLKERVELSEEIYGAEMGFKPLTGHTYHLYEKKNGEKVLSMIGPNEWARGCKYEKFVATARLMGDHTWDIIEKGEK